MDTTSSSFVFDNLDLNDCWGLPYTYTVKQAAMPEGYNESVSGYTITNSLKRLLVEVVHMDSSTGNMISSDYYPVFYGTSITIYAPSYIGYMPSSVPLYSFPRVTQDEVVFLL